jgi:hypothetical protein
MNKEFIPYEQALDLKQLGFDEAISTYYSFPDIEWSYVMDGHGKVSFRRNSQFGYAVSAPTFSQAFRWFREKYEYEVSIHKLIEEDGYMASIRWERVEDIFDQVEGNTYPEAELACLIKLIEICKKYLTI